VLEYARSDGRLAQPIFPGGPDVLAQVKHAVDNEEAMTVSDFLLRRSAIGLGPYQGLDAVETVAGEMASLLGWSSTERQNQIDSYRTVAALGRRFTK
jgi:glycerol-3-phosphate dehydrogenase